MTCTGSRNDNENDQVPGGRKSKEKSTKTEEDSVPGGRKTATEKDSVHGGRRYLTRGPVKPWCELWKLQKGTRLPECWNRRKKIN